MNRHSPRRTVWMVSAVALCLQFSVDTGRADAADANPVVIRYLNDAGFVPAYEIADALGFLKETGIRLQSEGDSSGGPQALAALAAGSVDVVGAADPAIINAIAGGAKILAVVPRAGVGKDANSKFFVLNDSPIKAAKDLKGKSIAINALGAHLDYTVGEYLRIHGMNKDDVKLLIVPGPQLDQTLRDQRADVVAAGGWQSTIAGKIATEGGVRVLFTDYDVLGDIVQASNVMERAFIDSHPRAVKDFVTASARATDWAADHPAEAKKLIAQILEKRGGNPAAAAYWQGYGLRPHALYTDHDIKFWLDLLVREGNLKPGQFSPEDIATNKYNANAQRVQH